MSSPDSTATPPTPTEQAAATQRAEALRAERLRGLAEYAARRHEPIATEQGMERPQDSTDWGRQVKLLHRLWFPRLRTARAARDRWMAKFSWTQTAHVRAVLVIAEQRERMKNQAARNLALRDENDSLHCALDALTASAKKLEASRAQS